MSFCRKYCRHIPKIFKHVRCSNKSSIVNSERYFYTAKILCEKHEKGSKSEPEIRGSISSKYEIFTDEKSIIFDIEEEREKFYEINDETKRAEKERRTFSEISSLRGTTGVIEIEELTNILKQEIAQDIVVIQIPEEYCYVNYFVIATCRSKKHMIAVAEYVKRVFKYKMGCEDLIPNIEGKNSSDWVALDIGNIVLHLFLQSSRLFYDLETLWTVGKEYDSIYNKKHNIISLIPDYASENAMSNATTVTS